MSDILFVPLNTNHVLIFNEVRKHLRAPYLFLCHDRVSGDPKYCTQGELLGRGLPFIHFSTQVRRSEAENLFLQIIDHFRLRHAISRMLDAVHPKVLVLAIDNDPLSNILLRLCRGKGIRSVIIQEGSARPDAVYQVNGFTGYVREALRTFGIQIGYVLHGMSGLFDTYLVAGPSSKEALQKRGVPTAKIIITGQPKYDPFMKKAKQHRRRDRDNRKLLFAAGFSVIADEPNRSFLKCLVKATAELGIELIIKIHPRSDISPSELRGLLVDMPLSHCLITKRGDDTLDLLTQCYGLITVASTVITEALILDREGILVNYLAKGQRLAYDSFAVHIVQEKESILAVLEDSIKNKKPFSAKATLLKESLHRLDGRSGERAAREIESLLKECDLPAWGK